MRVVSKRDLFDSMFKWSSYLSFDPSLLACSAGFLRQDFCSESCAYMSEHSFFYSQPLNCFRKSKNRWQKSADHYSNHHYSNHRHLLAIFHVILVKSRTKDNPHARYSGSTKVSQHQLFHFISSKIIV